MGDDKPLDGYIRVSQVAGRSGERFQSPGQQRESIAAWANANGVKIGKIHEDLDRSGGTMDRPGMNEALRRVDQGISGGLIVARLDRFARTVVGGLLTIRHLHDKGARVVSVAEALDPATPMGRAMLGLLLIMAEWQRDQADEHLAAAQYRATSAGRFPGKPSFGYTRTKDGLTVVDESAADVVREIFQARASGAGWRTIADNLSKRHIRTPLGRRLWAPSTVHGLIRSEAPLGVFVGPRGLRVEEAWPAIVERGLWEAANAVRGTRDDTRIHADRLLAGIARCAGCRLVLARAVNHTGFVSYGCQTRGCPVRPTIGAALLDGHVTQVINERIAGITLDPETPAIDGEAERLDAARASAVRELEAWRDDTELRSVLGDADWREGMLARARARDAAEADIAAFRARHGLFIAETVPDGVRLALDLLPWEARREVVDALLHSVWVRRSEKRGAAATRHVAHRVRVVWRDDPDLPALASRHVDSVPLEW